LEYARVSMGARNGLAVGVAECPCQAKALAPPLLQTPAPADLKGDEHGPSAPVHK